MTEHEVVIAGGGPTGLMLAAELAIAGVDAVVVERRTSQELDSSRAGGLHSRTIEVLDQRGVAERFISAGRVHPKIGYGQMFLDIGDFPTRHNYVLALPQRDFEPILADWVAELGTPILRGREVVGFGQDGSGVQIDVSQGDSVRAQYLVGCDGGRSVVRKAAGIDFTGWPASISFIIAEVEMAEKPPFGLRPGGGGIGPVDPAKPDGPFRMALKERSIEHTGPATSENLRAELVAAFGTDFGLGRVHWVSRFTDMSRQAVAYRRGRVLLAGDAAHVHAPYGGQGLNTGVQDAVNLGWKLARVVKGQSSDALLDTYHAERHPVGARVLHNTMAQGALAVHDDRHQALRDTMAELVAMDQPRRRIVGEISGLDIRYDLAGLPADLHPLIGRRMPDLDLQTEDGATRLFALLHRAEPVLLSFGAPGGFDGSPWAGLRVVEAQHPGQVALPVLGEATVPPAVLVRPDGHVAWAGELTDPGLPAALAF